MSSKKPLVVILKGSPRMRSNSALLADQVAAGALSGGADVESWVLQDLNIQPCIACDSCHQGPDAECVHQDGMQDLYPRLRAADAVVIASPIYWFNLSAQTKLCIDRWYALGGADGHALSGKKLGLVLVYGDTDPYTSGAINAIRTMQDACRYIGMTMVGTVYGSAIEPGEIVDQQAAMAAAFELGQKLVQ